MKAFKIGWVGLGNMGTPMALNLAKTDYDIFVYNRTASKAELLVNAGATLCKSVQEVIVNSDVIFTMLTDDRAVSSVYQQLLESDSVGKVFINMSTISPMLAVELSTVCQTKGAAYLDAPVAGSVKPATEGTLLVLAGGDREVYDTMTPLLSKLGKLVLYLGVVGQGSKAKLAINYYISITIAGIAESVTFAESNGISRSQMMEIINESALGNGMSRMKTPSIVADNYPVAFPLKYILKDLMLAQNDGLQTSISNKIIDTYQRAINEGYGDMDFMAVIRSIK